MFTAWDGYARVDYLPEPGRLQVTLLTIEPTVYRRLRPGLACAFAADDPAGPPTFVEVDMGAEPPYDARILLRGQLMSVVDELVGLETGTREARLRLNELTELAARWAPYRDYVLAPDQVAGRNRSGAWADGLWALFSGLGLARALLALPPPVESTHRGPEAQGVETDWREVELPGDLANAAGVEPRCEWAPYRDTSYTGGEDTGFLVRATGIPGRETRLMAGLDDVRGDWVALEPEEEGSSHLLADLPSDPGTEEPSLRFRTYGEER